MTNTFTLGTGKGYRERRQKTQNEIVGWLCAGTCGTERAEARWAGRCQAMKRLTQQSKSRFCLSGDRASLKVSNQEVAHSVLCSTIICWQADTFRDGGGKWRDYQSVYQTMKILITLLSNQSILKEINPEYSLHRLMLKLQYFSHLIQNDESLEKTLMLGKMECRRKRG